MKVTKDQFTYPISGNRTIAFPFLNHGFYSWLKKKEKKGGKKSMCDEPKPALAVNSPGQHHCRQAAAVAFLHLLTTHVNQIWICACEWRKSLSYDVGKLWNCVLVVWTYLAWDIMPSSDLLSFSGPYFDIFYPTSNQIVKYCHLDSACFP